MKQIIGHVSTYNVIYFSSCFLLYDIENKELIYASINNECLIYYSQ